MKLITLIGREVERFHRIKGYKVAGSNDANNMAQAKELVDGNETD